MDRIEGMDRIDMMGKMATRMDRTAKRMNRMATRFGRMATRTGLYLYIYIVKYSQGPIRPKFFSF